MNRPTEFDFDIYEHSLEIIKMIVRSYPEEVLLKAIDIINERRIYLLNTCTTSSFLCTNEEAIKLGLLKDD
jgi:hypothetical protein